MLRNNAEVRIRHGFDAATAVVVTASRVLASFKVLSAVAPAHARSASRMAHAVLCSHREHPELSAFADHPAPSWGSVLHAPLEGRQVLEVREEDVVVSVQLTVEQLVER